MKTLTLLMHNLETTPEFLEQIKADNRELTETKRRIDILREANMEKPPYEDGQKCIKLRCDSKRGTRLHPDDHDFIVKMFDDFPEWYSETEKDIFSMTKPFGA